ncbi:MAG TPA: pilus assembly protein CpaE [Polyangia bacterium]|nr:pilus assembly protein CpaE [Polyangia bacterium]
MSQPRLHEFWQATTQLLGERAQPARKAGRIYTFFGCRGGAGATTLAVNCAVRLAQSSPRGAVLVDLDVQLGDVLCALNLEPRDTLVDLVEDIDRLEPAALRRRLAAHASGLYALSQVGSLSQLEALRPEAVAKLLVVLSRHFDAVLVDGVRDFSDLVLPALDVAARIVMVLSADVPAVRAAARCVDVFRELGYADDKLFVVVNRQRRQAAVQPAVIASKLGLPVHATVTNDFPVVARALDLGALLAERAPRARVTRDVDRLASGLREAPATIRAPVPQPAGTGRRGFWRRLGFRGRRAGRAEP